MKQLQHTLLLISLLVFLASCQQRLYFPDRANTPGLTHALEGKVTTSLKFQANDNDTAHPMTSTSVQVSISRFLL